MIGDETPQPDTPAAYAESDPDAQRRCVACGYDLFGLGEEPRCPECGLLNIPSGFRQQVWDLVDSGKWLFSGFFTPFAKRPPGWWWALDRPGDVRRSFRIAARNVLIAALLILVPGVIADSILLETVTTHTYLDSTDPTAPPKEAGIQRIVARTWPWVQYSDDIDYTAYYAPNVFGRTRTTSTRILVEFSRDSLFASFILFSWAFWVWAAPAFIGLWTQIRKGLPKFARAPRTIIAAANYESHRLLYVAVLVVLWMLLGTLLRTAVPGVYLPNNPAGLTAFLPYFCTGAMLFAVAGIAAGGWVGALRSDYTKQLIRSRWHAGRVLIMYALVFPWIMTILSVATVTIILSQIFGYEPW